MVRWPVAAPEPGLSIDAVRPAAPPTRGDRFALLTLVPPAGSFVPVARDLIVLIDTSGSMSGQPLDQARRIVTALIDTLGDRDRIEMIAFDSLPRRFADEPVVATRDGKAAAHRWLRGLRAGGGTEMRKGVQEALRPLREDAQRQIILVTDGYIAFEREIVHEVRTSLPASCRLHTIGVGSAVNRSLTQAVARAGAGVEAIVAPREDVEPAVRRLVARTDRPAVTELSIDGDGVLATAPARLPDLYARTPVLIGVRLGDRLDRLTIRGRTATGVWTQTVTAPRLALGEGAAQVAVLFAREHVEDLEASLAGGADRRDVDQQIETTGLEFGIATRMTSWVAVSEQALVAPGTNAPTIEQPHEVPDGLDLGGLGHRSPAEPFGEGALEMEAQGFERARSTEDGLRPGAAGGLRDDRPAPVEAACPLPEDGSPPASPRRAAGSPAASPLPKAGSPPAVPSEERPEMAYGVPPEPEHEVRLSSRWTRLWLVLLGVGLVALIIALLWW